MNLKEGGVGPCQRSQEGIRSLQACQSRPHKVTRIHLSSLTRKRSLKQTLCSCHAIHPRQQPQLVHRATMSHPHGYLHLLHKSSFLQLSSTPHPTKKRLSKTYCHLNPMVFLWFLQEEGSEKTKVENALSGSGPKACPLPPHVRLLPARSCLISCSCSVKIGSGGGSSQSRNKSNHCPASWTQITEQGGYH